MYRHRWLMFNVFASTVLLGTAAALAERIARVIPAHAPGGPGTVNLPYTVNDSAGNNWYIYQNGSFRQQNNQPVYSQGGQILINGNYPNVNVNTARLDDKTGELIFENQQGQNCTVTRRILISREEGYLRVVDIIRNTQGQDATFNVMIQSQLNYSVQTSQTVPDPRVKTQNVGWVAHTSCNRSVAEMFCGRSAKVAPQISHQQGNSNVQATYTLAIPAGKEVAIMHVHATAGSQDAAAKWMTSLKESKLLSDMPAAIRKLIVNFRAGTAFIGDTEVLRGETLDVLELRTGDALRGTLKVEKYNLKTFYGPVELAADRIIGLINVGEFRPRQLLVTREGEIFGGELQQKDIPIELSNGQLTPVPLSQLSRAGYRKRAGESEEWNFDKPLILLRTGERMLVQQPTRPLDVVTRYGTLKLSPDVLAAVAFQAEEHGVHQVFLTDGSRFAGLVMGDTFEMKLAAGDQVVKFPASGIARLQLAGKVEDPDDSTASLSLANDDLLVGTLAGALKLDTAFSTLNMTTGEIRRLSRGKGSVQDVQVVLWDETTVSGQLQESEVSCKLKCGVEMNVPVALVEEYLQPRPTPSAAVAQTIEKLAADLNADDWQLRDAAQKKLVGMGTVVIGILKQLRAKQSPEGQQRIDQIIKELEKSEKSGGGASAAPPPPPPQIAPQIFECDFAIDDIGQPRRAPQRGQ
jgi:hypothetical protein